VRTVVEKLQIDPEAEMNPPEGTPADLTDAEPESPEHVPSAPGKINRLAESRMIDEDKETLEHILDRFKYEVRHFEQGGDLDEHLYDALYDYYCDTGDMPYGVQKAREGDPMEWVAQNLESHLRGGGIVDGAPDEDYAVEREGVEEEFKDPATQESDPYNTAEPAYPEYADPLSDILKTAGVPDATHPAPDYEHAEIEEAIPMSLEDEETDESSPLKGQYGHSGKMKPVAKDLSFLDRLKELSGMK